MKHFDLHCHPALKTFLGADTESERKDCWQEVDVRGIWEIVDKLIGDILDSQASLSQLKAGDFGLVVAAFYSLEHPMIVGSIEDLTNIRILSKRIPEVSHTLLQNMVDKEPGFGYNDVLKALKRHLLNSIHAGSGFKVLNQINELDTNKLNVILAIEGGHVLFNDLKSYTEEEIFQNLNELKNGPYRFLYLTLTHLANNPFCNQCYGMKLIEDKNFCPTGDGITQLGDEVIQRALETSSGNRIIIDVKHMSLKSRLQYYNRIKNNVYPKVPIIVSHAGVTGVSFNDMPIYHFKEEEDIISVDYIKPEGLQGTEFNPWSINLYDEEIPVIIESGGLIGIIMEERILGVGKVDPEYFSKDEFDDYLDNVKVNLNKYKRQQVGQLNREYKEQDEIYLTSKYLRHLCNNILHIVKVGGKEAWQHICFGTDYDGMINALNFMKTASKFEKMQRKLERVLPLMAKSDPDSNYFIEDIEKQVEDILYKNAIRFLEINFR